MAHHACIAIGINRYQFLPPLSYGQADAQALRQFLVCQANLPSSESLLLTDTSPLIDNQSTYPSRENIWRWIEAGQQNSSRDGMNRVSTNWRWFFFSGYGLNWEQADYLMPIDGNPDDIPGTGIPVRSLFAALKAQGNDNILVFLDINRSLGVLSETPVGIQTVELARQMGITLVLSSQINQFSHEVDALRQGLFTEALLEALGYYHTDITLEHLDQYLHTRLPELSQHHWRPVQTPLTVVPSEEVRQQLILPTAKNATVNQKTGTEISKSFISTTKLNAKDFHNGGSPNGTAIPVQRAAVSAVEVPPIKPISTTTTSNQAVSPPGAMIPHPNRQSELENSKTGGWQKLVLWGGGAVLILALMIAGVVLRNWDAFVNNQPAKTPAAKASPATSPLTSAKSSSTQLDRNGLPLAASPQTAQLSRLRANQAALDQAKRLLRPNQASLFNKAIIEAGKVKPGDPLYKQAQQDIKRWSEVILDLAEGRAEKGNFGAAIAAAQLVPKDSSSVYTKAQQTINQWKLLSTQQQQNQNIIAAAKKQIQPNQASSYNRAIRTLRQVPPDQPGYAEAQQLIIQNSQAIYQIAQTRASQAKFKEAIQTASLIPAGTPAYEASQKAIAMWKQGKR